MSDVISGVIDSISTKTVPTKRGDGTVYHASIGGQDVNLGFKNEFTEGENVSLNVEHKYGGWQFVSKATPGTPTSVSNSSTVAKRSTGSATSTEFPVPKNTKGIAICRQNSGGHAATIVAALVATGAIKTEQEAADAFMKLAYEITDFATGHREANQAAAMAGYEES